MKFKKTTLALSGIMTSLIPLTTVIACSPRKMLDRFQAERDLNKIYDNFRATKDHLTSTLEDSELATAISSWENGRFLSEEDFTNIKLSIPSFTNFNFNPDYEIKWKYFDKDHIDKFDIKSGIRIYLQTYIEAYGTTIWLQNGFGDDAGPYVMNVFPYVKEKPKVKIEAPEKFQLNLFDTENANQKDVYLNSSNFTNIWEGIFADWFDIWFKDETQSELVPYSHLTLEKQKDQDNWEIVSDEVEKIDLTKTDTYRVTYQSYYNTDNKKEYESEKNYLIVHLDDKAPEANFNKDELFFEKPLSINDSDSSKASVTINPNPLPIDEVLKKLITSEKDSEVKVIWNKDANGNEIKPDLTKPGKYDITFEVSDKASNKTTLTLAIEIVNK